MLEVEIASFTQQMINIMLLLIGVTGMITASGIYQLKRWGYWGTILLSAGTITFDVWASTIQFTSAMGLILPAIFITYLFSKRKLFQ